MGVFVKPFVSWIVYKQQMEKKKSIFIIVQMYLYECKKERIYLYVVFIYRIMRVCVCKNACVWKKWKCVFIYIYIFCFLSLKDKFAGFHKSAWDCVRVTIHESLCACLCIINSYTNSNLISIGYHSFYSAICRYLLNKLKIFPSLMFFLSLRSFDLHKNFSGALRYNQNNFN